MSLSFSTFNLLIDEKSPNINDLKAFFVNNEHNIDLRGIYYTIGTSNINDEFFWIYIRYGSDKPYTKEVYNAESEQEEENPKNQNQIEKKEQTFGLYSIIDKTFYLSNLNKKDFIKDHMKKKLNKDVIIKHFFVSAEKFEENIKTIKEVRWTKKPDLINSGETVMDIIPPFNDVLGLGMPAEFSLMMKFKDVKKSVQLFDWLKEMCIKRETGIIDSLMCIGCDDKNLKSVFNLETFAQKTSIPIQKNEVGSYDPEHVRDAIIRKIKENQPDA